MTITDKNIYYVGSPLPRPSKHLSAERLLTITLKSLIQLTGEGGKKFPTSTLLALMLSFITPMKGEPEHEGVSSRLLFFSLNSFSRTFNFFPLSLFLSLSFPTHFREKKQQKKKRGKEEKGEEGRK